MAKRKDKRNLATVPMQELASELQSRITSGRRESSNLLKGVTERVYSGESPSPRLMDEYRQFAGYVHNASLDPQEFRKALTGINKSLARFSGAEIAAGPKPVEESKRILYTEAVHTVMKAAKVRNNINNYASFASRLRTRIKRGELAEIQGRDGKVYVDQGQLSALMRSDNSLTSKRKPRK